MFSNNDLNQLGFTPDELQNFDPTGIIVDETNPLGRGKFQAAGLGKEAIFTIRIKNNDNATRRVELFNALNSIVEIPNDSEYVATAPVNGYPFRPFTSSGILGLLSRVAVDPETGGPENEGDVIVPSIAIFNDLSGDLCYVQSKTLTQWNANPLGAQDQNANIWVKCSQVPYKRLLADCKDLVLAIRMMKIQFASENQKKNALELTRVKSFGGSESNTLEPSEFFKPENQQSLVIDIPRDFYIDKATGIFFDLEPLEDMQITFFCKMFRNNGTVIA